ncbi:MAG: hypothetical protein WC442_00485 [Candidatus Omnitrophota bacterium]
MIIFVVLGIITSVFQLVTLREFNFSLARNELAFVIAAGFWIVFCSLGSIVKNNQKFRDFTLPILFSLTFSLSISLIHSAKSLIGLKYYEVVDPGLIIFLSLALIGPPAFVIGLAFRRFTDLYIRNNSFKKETYAKFFAFEAIGFFLGGVSFTVLLNGYSNPLIFSILPLLLIPAVGKIDKKIITAGAIIVISIISVLSFDTLIKKELDNADIRFNLGSGYGPVMAARKGKTTLLFSGGSLLATSEDRSSNEEFIHMSLSALETIHQKDILFIGASLSGQAEEIMKYTPKSLDFLQINPIISKLGKLGLTREAGGLVNFITDDPRLYLRNSNKNYDLILMNMPSPSNLGLNRYFTQEFFKLVSGRLKDKGIFSFNIASKREILSPQFVRFNSSIINAVDKIFTHRLIIPSDSMIIIASNNRIITDDYLLSNFSKAQPETFFFTIYHFRDFLSPGIRNYIQNMLDNKIPPNSDLSPSGFLSYLALEQAKFWPNLAVDLKKIPQAVIIFLFFSAATLLIVSYFSKRSLCLLNIACFGFNSISIVSIIFVLFQIYCGALFWKLGFLIALFMAGLSSGVFLINRIKPSRPHLLSAVYLLWAVLTLILFFILQLIGKLSYAGLIFYLLSFVCGLLTGAGYPCFADNLIKIKFNAKKIAPAIYSMDLAGAFLGTIVTGIFLIPFLGVPYSLLSLIFLNTILAFRNLGN